MAACCGSPRCNCRVTAGPGVTVDGNGSAATPYVISSAANPTPVQAGDTPTVDTTVAGTGTTADPYVVSSDVILDPAPPGGGSNLAHAGADGLYVECTDVRGCLSGGDGTAYDPATGEIDARPSTDAGNAVSFGTDGGLFAPTAAATIVEPQDSSTVDVTVTGTGTPTDPYEVGASVILDPAPPSGGTNLLAASPNGLHLECDDVRGCFSAGDGAAYDPATGVITARLSGDAGNSVEFGTDGGLFAPAAAGTALQGLDTTTVDMTVSGAGTAADPYEVSAAAIVAPEPNGLEAGPSGLLVAPSADAGNQLAMGGDGRLFVPSDVVGCGLTGDGTAASPLAVAPVAGERTWATDWACDAAANSTLHCDPSTGELWTPPEHHSATDTQYKEHFPTGLPAKGPQAYAVVDPAANLQFNIPAGFLSTCRRWNYAAAITGVIDISYSATTTFEVGYILSIDGGPAINRILWSRLTANVAGRERQTGSLHLSGFSLAPTAGTVIAAWPAIRVIAGSATINSWISDYTISLFTT